MWWWGFAEKKEKEKSKWHCAQIDRKDASETVFNAIRIGYRHIDSACDYGNEREVGEGIQRALEMGICKREELWITSKIWMTYHAPAHVEAALEKTLSDLKLEYLDLWMVHFPFSLEFVPFEVRYPPEWTHDGKKGTGLRLSHVPLIDTWGAMTKMQEQGRVKALGVCNMSSGFLMDFMNNCTARGFALPKVLQVELHPYLVQPHLVRFAQSRGLVVVGFSPLGAGSYGLDGESVMKEPLVLTIAAEKKCSAAQVILAWARQRGVIPIVKSTHMERLNENFASQSVELLPEQVAAISSLDKNRRFNDPAVFCENDFGTHCPIYQ